MCRPLPLVIVPAALAATALALLAAVTAYHACTDLSAVEGVVISFLTGLQVAAERALDGDLAGAVRALLRV
jgi:hypothetical protein